MKAKVIREPYRLANLKIGEVVEIIPGMETDAEGIWNIPAGKLVMCKKGDGTFCYASLLHMEIIDESPSVDWSTFRREAAKNILCALVGNKDYLKVIGRIEPETMLAIRFTDELIEKLKEESK